MKYAIVENGVCSNVIEAAPSTITELGFSEYYRVPEGVSVGDTYNQTANAFEREIPVTDFIYDENGEKVVDENGNFIREEVGTYKFSIPVIS